MRMGVCRDAVLAGGAGERGVGCEHVPGPLGGQDRGQGEQDQGTHQVPLPNSANKVCNFVVI